MFNLKLYVYKKKARKIYIRILKYGLYRVKRIIVKSKKQIDNNMRGTSE